MGLTLAVRPVPVNGMRRGAAGCRAAWRSALRLAGRPIFVACALAFLAACSPHFDWRDYRAAEGFEALFPGKVQKASRAIDLDGLPVTMTMQGARVDQIEFVIGTVTLQNPDAATLEQAQAAVAKGLIQNLHGAVLKDETLVIPAVQPGSPGITARGLEVSAMSGATGAETKRIVARIAARGDHVYQILVAGPAAALEEPEARQAIDTFLASVRLE